MDPKTKHKIARHVAALLDEVFTEYDRRIAELEDELRRQATALQKESPNGGDPAGNAHLRRRNAQLEATLKMLVGQELEKTLDSGEARR